LALVEAPGQVCGVAGNFDAVNPWVYKEPGAVFIQPLGLVSEERWLFLMNDGQAL
jgi:hypothetical protein